MRSSRIVVLGSLVVFAPLGWAQKEAQSQEQQDGFAGRVKSVTTVVQSTEVRFEQPAGPTLVIPVWCHDCEYSRDGYRTRSGQVQDGKFLGEVLAISRDGNGRVTEVTATDAGTGEPLRHTVMGPFGKTEETYFLNGKVRGKSTMQYDPYGHVTDWVSVDANGTQTGRTLETWTREIWTQRTVWNETGAMQWRETYDPEKDEQHYTGFDGSGNVRVNWTFAQGKVTSFWEPSNSTGEPGDRFSESGNRDNPKTFHCGNTGACESGQVLYRYADTAKQNPTSAEWRDGGGNLLYGAYYTYTFDATGNWTHREISVWSADLGSKTLYETDDRLITYWE